MRISQGVATAGGVLAVIALITGCSSSTEVASKAKSTGIVKPATNGNLADLCGQEDIKVGFLKSNGGGTVWDKQAEAEFKDEASKCPNITKALYADASNDQAKAISNLNSFVAQGVNVVVMTPDYGPAQLPSMRQAVAAGVTLISVWDSTGGVVGKDMSAVMNNDFDDMGKQWADHFHQQLPDGGKVVFLGGSAANSWSTSLFDPFKRALAQYPNLKLVGDTWQVTDWDPAKRKQVMTGLLAQHGRIDAVVSDSSLSDIGALQAYDEAGFTRPVIGAVAGSNQVGCDWQKKPYPYLLFGSTSSIPRAALRLGVGIHQGTTDESGIQKFVLPASTYMPGGELAPCNPALPPDADLTADLTDTQMNQLFR
jgi:ribose transport system substrate-binding protein